MKNKELIFSIGNRVSLLRKLKDMNQYDLAYKSGRMVNTISKLERGIGDPRISTLKDVSDALGVDLPELLDTSLDKKKGYKSSNEYIIRDIIKTIKNFDETKLRIIQKQVSAFVDK